MTTTAVITDMEKQEWEYSAQEDLELRDNEVSILNIPMGFIDQERIDIVAMGIERCLRDFKLGIKVKGAVIEHNGVPHMNLDFLMAKNKK